MTTIELKAQAYDVLAQIELHQLEIQKLQQHLREIANKIANQQENTPTNGNPKQTDRLEHEGEPVVADRQAIGQNHVSSL